MSRPRFIGYRCSICGTTYGPDQLLYTCTRDSGNLDVVLDLAELRKRRPGFDSSERSLWRYLPLLPVSDPGELGLHTPFRSVGCTPLFSPPRLNRSLGIRRLWIKDEGRNPTASYKDRASALVIRRALELGVGTMVTASTGNAGAALAGLAAAVGRQSVVFAPRSAPEAKIAQLLVFGARVFLVEGNYDQAVDLSLQAVEAFGWYCRNTGTNPFTLEGKKTAAYEIWEALGQDAFSGVEPLAVFVPVGDGNIISGLHRGFEELAELGWIERLPRLFGVQAEGSAAIARAFAEGTETIRPVQAETLADSIAVNRPADGVRALRAVRRTGGAYLQVRDEQILAAIRELGRAGLFAEPAAAAALAGLKSAVEQKLVGEGDSALVVLTGSGLKDVPAAARAVPEATIIEPTLQAVEKAL